MIDVLIANIQRLMKEQNTDEWALSKAIKAKHGTSVQLVPDIISGKSLNPQFRSIKLIAEELGVSTSELAGEIPGASGDLNILKACLNWVLQNFELLRTMSADQVTEELMKQYVRMVQEKVKDPREAVRITKFVFEALAEKPKAKKK